MKKKIISIIMTCALALSMVVTTPGGAMIVRADDETCGDCGADWEPWEKKDDDYHERKCKGEPPHTELEPHDWVLDEEYEDYKPATCQEDGYGRYVCSKCSAEKFAEIPKDPDAHVWGTHATKVDDDNHKIKCTCEGCNEETTEAHTWDDGEITAQATCSSPAKRTKKCTKCDATIEMLEGEIDSDAHDWGDWQSISDTKHKRVCTLNDEHCEEADHNWGDWTTVTEPTCTSVGKKKHTCKDCGKEVTEDIAIVDDAHKYGEWTYDDINNHKCVCEHNASHVKKEGHTWDNGTITTQANCVNKGVRTYTCKVCKGTKTEEIPETGVHNWSDWKIEVEASCTTAGKKSRYCTICQAKETKEIDPHGHNPVKDNAKAATCTEAGLTEGSHCSECDAVITVQKTVKMLGHSWDEGKVTTEPGCTTKGVTTFTCKRCGATKAKSIAKLGHKEVKDPAVPATEDETGLTEGSHCSVCGKVIVKQKVVPRLERSVAKNFKTGKNYKAALKHYKIDEKNVMALKPGYSRKAINDVLKQAGKKASKKKIYMVYAPEGKYDLTEYLIVPSNVVLVGEKKSYFKSIKKYDKVCLVQGSVYGGNWNANYNVTTIMRLDYVVFSGINGEIRNCIMTKAKRDGVHYGSGISSKKLGNAKAINNTMSYFNGNGVEVMNGAHFKEISGNKITNIKVTGIQITHSDADVVKNNTIINAGAHGIGTDTHFTGMVQKKMHIKQVVGNYIKNVKCQGLYLEDGCTIDLVKNNTIIGGSKCGICIDINSGIKKLEGNTILKNKWSNITLKGKGAYLVVGKNNTIKNSKKIGIMVSDKAKLTIKGTGNVITGNKNDIRVMKSKKAKFTYPKKLKKKNTIKNIRIV